MKEFVSAEAIDALLPQTQCGECGYAGCKPYAQAMAKGEASIDKCPPGGVKTVQALAHLLKQDPTPYLEAAKNNTRAPAVADIVEAECIGCTKCIQACPVDAIIGTAKRMHAVVVEACTGCGLCIEPCPVDCIVLHPLPFPQYNPEAARQRFEVRNARLLQEKQTKEKKDDFNKQGQLVNQKAYIQAALARVIAKKS